MARSFSVYRRLPGILDLTIRSRPGVKEYQFKAATNFDAAFNLFQVVPAAGMVSYTIPNVGTYDSQFRNLTRFAFNPNDYTLAVPAVSDSKPFWIRVAPVDFSGVVGPDEAMHLVLPFSSTPSRAYNISGSLGVAVTELQLPYNTSNPIVEVNGANNVYMAFEPNSYEFKVPSLGTEFSDYRAAFQTFSQLFLRGSADPTVFFASFRLVSNQMM